MITHRSAWPWLLCTLVLSLATSSFAQDGEGTSSWSMPTDLVDARSDANDIPGSLAEESETQPTHRRRPLNRIGVAAGASHLAHQDLIHTPFVHGGASPISVGLSYSRHGGRWSHFAEARYSAFTSRIGEPYEIDHGVYHHENLPHGFLFVEVVYGAGRTTSSGPSHTATAGGSARFDLQGVFYRFGGHDNLGYFLGPSMNLWYAREQRLAPRHLLSGRIEAPVVSWLSRSPYMVNDDRFIEHISSDNRLKTVLAFLGDGQIVTWDRLQRLNAALDYEYALSRRFSAGASYRFAFIRSAEPRPLTSLQSSLNLTSSFRF